MKTHRSYKGRRGYQLAQSVYWDSERYLIGYCLDRDRYSPAQFGRRCSTHDWLGPYLGHTLDQYFHTQSSEPDNSDLSGCFCGQTQRNALADATCVDADDVESSKWPNANVCIHTFLLSYHRHSRPISDQTFGASGRGVSVRSMLALLLTTAFFCCSLLSDVSRFHS